MRRLAQTAARFRGGVFAPIDAVLAVASMLAAHALSPVFEPDVLGPAALVPALVHAVAFVLAGQAVGLYDRDAGLVDAVAVRRVALAAGLAPMATLALFYLVAYRPIGRRVVLVTAVLSVATVLVARLVVSAAGGRHRRRVLLVGHDAAVAHTRAALAALPGNGFEVVALWPSPRADLAAFCATGAIDDIVLGAATVEAPGVLAAALSCLPAGCRTRTAADFHEDVFREVPVQHVDAAWLLAGGWDATDHVGDLAKRLFDVTFAAVLLVGAAPLLVLAALAVKLGDGGPVLYTQQRVGRYGRRFRILKLRTMADGAEQGAPVWAAAGDSRVTAVGRVLRRTRLDELPQVLNILAGHMSFVGPRPERPEFVEELERAVPHYAWRHLIRPGLTGWAQIRLGYGASVDDARRKLECDLYYLRRRSFLLDLLILLRTAGVLPRGAR